MHLWCGRVFQSRGPSEKSANVCLQSGHRAVCDRSEGGGCAADAGLSRLKKGMPDADECRAFPAISLLSTRVVTSLTTLSSMALVPNTSRRMSKSAVPAIGTSLVIESVKSTSRRQVHFVMKAHVSTLPRNRAANARNDSSRSCCMRTSSARITPVATTMTASDFMAAMTTEVGSLTMDGSGLSRLSPNSSPTHWKGYDGEARVETGSGHEHIPSTFQGVPLL